MLSSHMRNHTGEKTFRCSVCENAFIQKSHLITHMRTHTGEKPFRCSVCGNAFSYKCHLITHMRTHTGEKPFRCSVCENAFSRKSHLVPHMRTHTGEKPFRCSVCENAFSRKHDVVKHMRTHTGEKPFRCSVCGNAFSQKNNLVNHVRTHNREREKPFVCNLCKKCFLSKGGLKYHLITHENKDLFKCSEKEKVNGSKRKSAQHFKVHKTYKCSKCSKLIDVSRVQYKRVRDGEPYKCSECEMIAVASSSNLKIKEKSLFVKEKSLFCSIGNTPPSPTSVLSPRDAIKLRLPNIYGKKSHLEEPSLLQRKGVKKSSRKYGRERNEKKQLKKDGEVHHGSKTYEVDENILCNEEEYHACEFCEEKYISRNFLLQHKMKHAVVKIHKCDVNVESNEKNVAHNMQKKKCLSWKHSSSHCKVVNESALSAANEVVDEADIYGFQDLKINEGTLHKDVKSSDALSGVIDSEVEDENLDIFHDELQISDDEIGNMDQGERKNLKEIIKEQSEDGHKENSSLIQDKITISDDCDIDASNQEETINYGMKLLPVPAGASKSTQAEHFWLNQEIMTCDTFQTQNIQEKTYSGKKVIPSPSSSESVATLINENHEERRGDCLCRTFNVYRLRCRLCDTKFRNVGEYERHPCHLQILENRRRKEKENKCHSANTNKSPSRASLTMTNQENKEGDCPCRVCNVYRLRCLLCRRKFRNDGEYVLHPCYIEKQEKEKRLERVETSQNDKNNVEANE